jgi:hypothetical protein
MPLSIAAWPVAVEFERPPVQFLPWYSVKLGLGVWVRLLGAGYEVGWKAKLGQTMTGSMRRIELKQKAELD